MSIHLIFDEGGEWTALYKDGRKVAENHTLDERDVLDALDIKYTSEHRKVDCNTGAMPDGTDPFPEVLT